MDTTDDLVNGVSGVSSCVKDHRYFREVFFRCVLKAGADVVGERRNIFEFCIELEDAEVGVRENALLGILYNDRWLCHFEPPFVWWFSNETAVHLL